MEVLLWCRRGCQKNITQYLQHPNKLQFVRVLFSKSDQISKERSDNRNWKCPLGADATKMPKRTSAGYCGVAISEGELVLEKI